MSRTSRALIAGGAALALLAGSGATFARWYDEKTVLNGEIKTGHMSISVASTTISKINMVKDDKGTKDVDELDVAVVEFNPATDRLSPGDVIEITKEINLSLSGKNLDAALGVQPTEGTVGVLNISGFDMQCTKADGSIGNAAHLTEADNGGKCTLKIRISYNFGADNAHSALPENQGDGAHGDGWEIKTQDGVVALPDFKAVIEQNTRHD